MSIKGYDFSNQTVDTEEDAVYVKPGQGPAQTIPQQVLALINRRMAARLQKIKSVVLPIISKGNPASNHEMLKMRIQRCCVPAVPRVYGG